MALGDLLLKNKLLSKEELAAALEYQRVSGGLLGDTLINLGFITQEKLEEVLSDPPRRPETIDDTRLNSHFLVNSILKLIYVSGLETISEFSNHIKLSRGITEELVNIAKKEHLIEVQGAANANYTALRHALTGMGRERAIEAYGWCQYTGPVPVPLSDYHAQVQKQTITNERINAKVISKSLSHLILPEETLRQLGPAINSGKAILLYGFSGNGKTSVAEAIGDTFNQTIYIPHAIEVDGQIIKVFDPSVHKVISSQPDPRGGDQNPIYLPKTSFDPRWVRCSRPVIISGGELTLDMLDLEFDALTKSYEAPLQVKATGGVYVIDDFGRQLVRPHDLLNRWIIPLERKLDYLTLHTGKKFDIPFDELVIFSTNISPGDLMDTAFLRRIHYKLRMDPPSEEDYKAIFRRICEFHHLEISEDMLSHLLHRFYYQNKVPLAAFHPKFIVEHAIASCNYEGVTPHLDLDLVKDALKNLVIAESTSPSESGDHE